jgi:hypothetical protein
VVAREVGGVIIMRRFGVIVALGALLGMFGGVVTASPALAGRGHKWELLQAAPFTFGKSFCGFKLRVTFPAAKEYTKLLKAADGSMLTLTTGSLKSTYTNLSTGKAITENTSGPGKITTHPDGSITARLTGHSGVLLSPAAAKRFGLPTVSVTAGPLTESVAADGSLTSLSLHGGHVLVDVCAALS